MISRAEGLSFGHPGRRLLFDRFSLTLPAGVTWVGGDEGRGKTTLLQLLAAALPGAWRRCSGTSTG